MFVSARPRPMRAINTPIVFEGPGAGKCLRPNHSVNNESRRIVARISAFRQKSMSENPPNPPNPQTHLGFMKAVLDRPPRVTRLIVASSFASPVPTNPDGGNTLQAFAPASLGSGQLGIARLGSVRSDRTDTSFLSPLPDPASAGFGRSRAGNRTGLALQAATTSKAISRNQHALEKGFGP